VAYWFATLRFDLLSCESGPCGFPLLLPRPPLLKTREPSTPKASSPSGYFRKPRPVGKPKSRWLAFRAPLLGFRSLQRSPVQWSCITRASHHPAPCAFEVLTFLDALIPITPPGHLCPGHSWDCNLQGFAPPEDSKTFRS